MRQSRHQIRVRMSQRIDRDTGAEIQISRAILGEKVSTFAPDECDIRPIIGWQHSWKHGTTPGNACG
jgi:hypothetical protein